MPKTKKTTKKKSIPFWKVYGVLALLLIGGGLFLRLKFVSQPTFTQVPTFTRNEKKPSPTRLLIPSISLSLGIEAAFIKDGRWYVSPTQATFLQNGRYPGEEGPIILYGHNKKKIFGPLIDVKKGATITLVSADQKIYSYKVYKIQTVSPDQIDILDAQKETLIIFTCTGFTDSKRLVIKAYPIRK